MVTNAKKKLAVWKFASCDGCQLSLLDCEDELLTLGEHLQIAYFLEATKKQLDGPYDLSLVEGSITTNEDAKRIKKIRKQSKTLVTIGACATSGGIQALRNYQNIDDYIKYVYPKPEYIQTLASSTPISLHVKVDYQLQGCPINKYQLLEVCRSFLMGKKPNISSNSVCTECKLKGNTCVMVAEGIPCLGPVTHAGCGALCPSYARGCYGCYGPKETANAEPLAEYFKKQLNQSNKQVLRVLRNFNNQSQAFASVSKDYDK